MPMPRPGVDFDPAEHPPADENHPVMARISRLSAGITQWGFDYAWESPPVAQLLQLLNSNQADFVCRYINDPGGKGIDSTEAFALDAANIIIAPVYETTGTDFRGGYAAGFAAGGAAASLLRARRAPAGSYCWFAIDTDTTDYASTNAYLRGAKAATAEYTAQLYGKFGVVEAAFAAGLGDKHWQTYAWSHGQLSTRAALYQYQNGVTIGGISMDRDKTLTRMSGPWAHFGAAPPPPPDWTEQMIMALPTLGPGDTDLPGGTKLVHRIQKLVNGIGDWNSLGNVTQVTDDGVYGPATIAGVKRIQQFFGLPQDGITGPDTWRKLIGA